MSPSPAQLADDEREIDAKGERHDIEDHERRYESVLRTSDTIGPRESR